MGVNVNNNKCNTSMAEILCLSADDVFDQIVPNQYAPIQLESFSLEGPESGETETGRETIGCTTAQLKQPQRSQFESSTVSIFY